MAVGAPPLSFSTRAVEIFLIGNAVDTAVIGVKIPAATRTVLEQADGHLGRAIRLTLATYDGDWKRLMIDDHIHGVIHRVRPVKWVDGKREQILSASFDGITLHQASGDPSDGWVAMIGPARHVLRPHTASPIDHA